MDIEIDGRMVDGNERLGYGMFEIVYGIFGVVFGFWDFLYIIKLIDLCYHLEIYNYQYKFRV